MKILIAGSGKMGTDLFYYLIGFDFQLVCLCQDASEASAAVQAYEKRIARQLRAGLIDDSKAEQLKRDVVITCDINQAANCGLLIEAIWEIAGEKAALFSRLDEVLPNNCIIATNTSSVPLREIFQIPSRLAYCCGLHFFYPVKIRDLVEVNLLNDWSKEAEAQLNEFLTIIQRNPLFLQEGEHFLLNRMLLPLQNEAVKILNEGLSTVNGIDAVVRDALFPIGVFEFFDHVGIDVMAASVQNYIDAFGKKLEFHELLIHLQERQANGQLGMKNRQGYYSYPIAAADFDIHSLTEGVATEIRQRLEKAFYTELEAVLQAGIMSEEKMDSILQEYWGISESAISRGRSKGFLK